MRRIVVCLAALCLLGAVSTGCSKKKEKKGGSADCGALYDKMADCSKKGLLCGLGIKPMPKKEWLKERCQTDDPDSIKGWTKIQKRCLKRPCKDFCKCLDDTLGAHNGLKGKKVWPEAK